MAKRQRGADSTSASGGKEDAENLQQLENEVGAVQDQLDLCTLLLGQGKNSSGWVDSTGPRGVAVRCALSLKCRRQMAQGIAPKWRHASAQGVQTIQCAHKDRIGPCQVVKDLALCYYCMTPICREHRVLIAGARLCEGGRQKGGATCACIDREACKGRVDDINSVLSVGKDAVGGKGKKGKGASASGASSKGKKAQREQEKGKGASASGASSTSQGGRDYRGSSSWGSSGSWGGYGGGGSHSWDSRGSWNSGSWGYGHGSSDSRGSWDSYGSGDRHGSWGGSWGSDKRARHDSTW